MKRYTRGFTLIELLVVIAIIGILASVVLVSLQSARKKGNDSRVQSNISQIRIALESGYSGNTYPDLKNQASPTFGAERQYFSTNIETLVADILAQQNAGGLSGTGYSVSNNSGAYAAGSVIITKDAVSPATGYAIYAKLPSSGSAFCIDSSGNAKTSATYPTTFAGMTASTATNCQ